MKLEKENKIMKPDSRNKPIATVKPARIEEEIRNRAYELFERGTPGDAMAHWLEAEQQLG